MSQSEYYKLFGEISAGGSPDIEELSAFLRIVSEMESMLDEADEDDYFGTEGWKHRLGWD